MSARRPFGAVSAFDVMSESHKVYTYVIQALALANTRVAVLLNGENRFCDLTVGPQGEITITFLVPI